MISRRTISYIGLWALIMPWLGFSWETKTVLFSLTGVLLLFIGNRYYNSEKNKQKKDHSKTDTNVEEKSHESELKNNHIANAPISTYKPVPDYMELNHKIYNPVHTIQVSPEQDNFIPAEKPKHRIQKKIEMIARPKRTSPKPVSLDSLNIDHE